MVKNQNQKKYKTKTKKYPKEIGGPSGLEPTRYGDWEKKVFVTTFKSKPIFYKVIHYFWFI